MTFLDWLRPRAAVPTVYDLDLEDLRRRGIRGLILDIDNTLVAWGSNLVGERLLAWITDARSRGWRMCLVANARAGRVRVIAASLGLPAISNAGKPRRGSFRRAMHIMGTAPAETAVIGDQLFTDVLGGNRLGLYTVLVTPIARREFLWTRLVRPVEGLILRAIGLARFNGSRSA